MGDLQGRLLVLDDDYQVSSTIREMAKIAGFEARSCTDATEFFACLQEFEPTHLILDLAMPGVDGVEVMRQLAIEQCDATLIIVSGLGAKVLKSAQIAAAESGLRVAGVLPKPFRMSALKALLKDYTDQSNKDAGKRKTAELTQQELQQALDQERLVVFYQPQVSCHTRRVTGFEALVRIISPEHELISPDRFIPLAERTGQIHQLTQQVFSQAICWFAEHFRDARVTLALNTSPSILAETAYPHTISKLAEQCGLEPHRIKLEVTETSAAENPSMALELLTQLRVKGYGVAIDDFGVGYSSLEQLVRQPFSELKLDKNFIIPLARSEESRKIAAALIALAKALKLTTTAEGVENEESLSYLALAGCEHAQGFYIGRPMAGDTLLMWLANYKPVVQERGAEV